MLNSFDLGGLRISTNSKSIVIAEIGPNHNGSLSEAKKLIDFAKKAGCSAVKFQYHLAASQITKVRLMICHSQTPLQAQSFPICLYQN